MEKLLDFQKLQNDDVRCCLGIKNPRDANLLDHRRTVQLLTCVKKGVDDNYLPHIWIEEATLRNQSRALRERVKTFIAELLE